MIADDGALVTALVLWDVLLAIVVLAVVPLVLYLAARLVRASRNIRVHFETTLAAAAGVAANTGPTTPALDQTIGVATEILGVAGAIDEHSAAVESLLTQRAQLGSSR